MSDPKTTDRKRERDEDRKHRAAVLQNLGVALQSHGVATREGRRTQDKQLAQRIVRDLERVGLWAVVLQELEALKAPPAPVAEPELTPESETDA